MKHHIHAGVVIGDLKCDDICQVDKLEIYGPVCGSDGKTYDTECALKIAVCESKIPVSIVYHGENQIITLFLNFFHCQARKGLKQRIVGAPVAGRNGGQLTLLLLKKLNFAHLLLYRSDFSSFTPSPLRTIDLENN